MPKRILQDVIPAQKKTIRDVPLPRERKVVVEKNENKDAKAIVREEFERRDKTKRKFAKYGIILAILVAVIGSVVLAEAFKHATVTLVLASESDPVSASLSTGGSSPVGSTPISVVKQGSVTLTATTSKDVETKATGSIVIFNDYSTTVQKLIANTRFETSDGLIYRITQSVSVPGKTTKSGVTTPGSVTVSVIADQTGQKYNIDLTDFTIPGFTGEPQYDGVFARSKTAMTGGYSGMQPVISASDRATAVASLKSNLGAEVSVAGNSSVPSDYVLYPSATTISYIDLPDTVSGQKVTINEEASLSGVALSDSSLSSALAAASVKGYAGEPINVSNLSTLTLATAAVPTASSTAMNFTVNGSADFVWTIDPNAFASQLAGQSSSDFTQVLKGYPHVEKADVSFFPFWSRSFPKNANDISIKATSTPQS